MLTLRYNEPVFILMLRGRVGCLRHVNIESKLRTELFSVITQRVVVIITTTRWVTTQKSAVLIYFAAEAWNYANHNFFQERISNKLKVLTAVLSKIQKSSGTLLREIPKVSRDYTPLCFQFWSQSAQEEGLNVLILKTKLPTLEGS